MQVEAPSEASPAVACLRCRGQKLRCNRELPSCLRCRKQGAECSYPPPPDRKRIAQETSRSRALLSNGVEQDHRFEPSAAEYAEKRHRGLSSISDDDNNDDGDDAEQQSAPKSETSEAAELPSTEVGLLLLEVYFKRIYHATLLFNKDIAFQLYLQNGIPAYLLRAIFAHAAIFLQQVDAPLKKCIKVVPIHALLENSWAWARSASQEVLSLVDEPTLSRVQALQVLQFFYFSRDEIQRAIVHASLAYRLSQLLGYDRLFQDFAAPSIDRNLQFDHEFKRRCFWATWCSFCIGSEQQDTSGACERVTGLPLPAKIQKGGSLQGVNLKQGPKMGVDWKVSTDSASSSGTASSSCSLMAELVKLLGLWTKVQAFISDLMRSNSERTNQLNILVETFEPIERSIQPPLDDLCSRAKLYDESPELLISVYSVYHLSRLLMHASMVPLLSGCPAGQSASRQSVQGHAEMVLQQATQYAELLKQFVANGLDFTRLSPFSGYVAFVTGSVFIVYKGIMQSAGSVDQSMQVPGPESQEMSAIRTALGVLSTYWKPLRGLAVKLHKAIHAGQSSVADLITSPTCPWNTRHPGYSLDDHGNAIGVSENTNSSANMPLSQFSPACFLTGGQTAREADGYWDGTRSYRRPPEQQFSPRARASTEGAVLQPPGSGYSSDDTLKDILMDSSEGGLFDTGSWNHAPAPNV